MLPGTVEQRYTTRAGRIVLTKTQEEKLRKMCADAEPLSVICKEFGWSRRGCWRIRKRYGIDKKKANRKTPPRVMVEIKRMKALGMLNTKIADIVGVHPSLIRRIVRELGYEPDRPSPPHKKRPSRQKLVSLAKAHGKQAIGPIFRVRPQTVRLWFHVYKITDWDLMDRVKLPLDEVQISALYNGSRYEDHLRAGDVRA